MITQNQKYLEDLIYKTLKKKRFWGESLNEISSSARGGISFGFDRDDDVLFWRDHHGSR